jgi:hypothetical protein
MDIGLLGAKMKKEFWPRLRTPSPTCRSCTPKSIVFDLTPWRSVDLTLSKENKLDEFIGVRHSGVVQDGDQAIGTLGAMSNFRHYLGDDLRSILGHADLPT